MSRKQHDSSVPGVEFGRPAPTRLVTPSEDRDIFQFTPEQSQALCAVYQLIAGVAQRVRDEGLERAA